MSAYANRESYFERLSQEVLDTMPGEKFFEKVRFFRSEIANESELSRVHTFRTLCAELHIAQYTALKNSRVTLQPGTMERFFEDLVVTPHLMFQLTQLSINAKSVAEAQQESAWITSKIVEMLPCIDFGTDYESYLLTRSLRQLTNDLAGTGMEHSLAQAILTTPIDGKLMAGVVIKSYLEMGDREVLDFAPTEALAGIDVTPAAAASATSWLRSRETEVVEAVLEGGQSQIFNERLQSLADLKGFPAIAWAMRIRQKEYSPTELLRNVIDHGTHPDDKLVAIIEDEKISISIASRIQSHSALIAYCLVHNADSTVFKDSKFLKASQKKALHALASLRLEPHESRMDTAIGMAQALIDAARDYQDVEWLSELSFLDDKLKESRKFQGMRLESDLGM